MFSPILPALADVDPGISLSYPVASWPFQPPAGLPEASGAVAAPVGRAEPIAASTGRFTGLDLPKALARRTEDAGADLPHDGPQMQPLQPGLPQTPIEACRELMLAIVVRGILDHDLPYIVSPTFLHHLMYIGLDPDAALNVKIAYLQGRINVANLDSVRMARGRSLA